MSRSRHWILNSAGRYRDSAPSLGSPLALPSRDTAGADGSRTFHHFKLSTHNQRIVTDLRFVKESNRGIGAATGRHGVIRAINELDAQVFSVAIADPKMRPVTPRTGR
jgi:hypothetical protein